jgi:hypothetical protein
MQLQLLCLPCQVHHLPHVCICSRARTHYSSSAAGCCNCSFSCTVLLAVVCCTAGSPPGPCQHLLACQIPDHAAHAAAGLHIVIRHTSSSQAALQLCRQLCRQAGRHISSACVFARQQQPGGAAALQNHAHTQADESSGCMGSCYYKSLSKQHQAAGAAGSQSSSPGAMNRNSDLSKPAFCWCSKFTWQSNGSAGRSRVLPCSAPGTCPGRSAC